MLRRIKLVITFFVVATIVISCAQQGDALEQGPNVVAKVIDGKMKLEYGDLQIREVFAAEFDGVDKVEEWTLEESGSHYYLQARGIDPETGYSVLTAIELDRVGNDLVLDYTSLAKVKNSCVGDNCSCCAFIKDSTDKIVGCHCNFHFNPQACNPTGNGVCNHTIEEIDSVVTDPAPGGSTGGGGSTGTGNPPVGSDSTGGGDSTGTGNPPVGGDTTGGDSSGVPFP